MSGTLTCSTHVLDVALGAPAVGVQVELSDTAHHRLAWGTTDPDGRVRFDVTLEPGSYALTFATGEWFAAAGRTTYFPTVVVAFVAAEDQQHHHVPLLLSPFSYTTYRGHDMTDGDIVPTKIVMGPIVLGDNQYGKAECRLVRIDRDTATHEITDLTVTSQLRGDFTACHIDGDNSQVVATDTQKNTVYAFARQHGIASPEEFLLTLGRHFVTEFPWVHGGRWEAQQHAWDRIRVDDQPHDHAFVRTRQETRTTVVQVDGDETFVISGLTDCTVLKSTGSEFHGFPRDRYTSLQETTDRILATSITARWRYTDLTVDFDSVYASIRQTILETFATVHSLALQQTIFAVGKAVLERHAGVAEIKLSCPNKHHFLVDLAPFDLDNPGEVFFAADRPYGLIEATVQREGGPEEPRAWASIPGFL